MTAGIAADLPEGDSYRRLPQLVRSERVSGVTDCLLLLPLPRFRIVKQA